MLKFLMMMGLMKKRGFMARKAGVVAPFGGGLPLLAFLAYKNRDKIKAAYERLVAPRLKQTHAGAH